MEFIKTLDNGLRIIVKKMEGLLSVTTGILVGAGSVYENDKNNGISHYIEHMMFKGTKKRTSFEISEQMDRIGAQMNAFTSKERTCYYVKSTSEHFERAFEILSDLFLNATFDEEEAKKEKGVILEEISMTEDTPDDICMDLMAESYFGLEGLGRTILGKAENVKAFTNADVKEYMDKFYTPYNTVISIVGNVDVDKAIKTVEKYFADYNKPKTDIPLVKNKTMANSLIRVKDIEQAHIGLVANGFRYGDEAFNSFQIVNAVFGGGMSSRLFQTIREKLGLAYTVMSYASPYQDLGTFEIYAGVNPKNRDLALEEIVKELKTLKKDGITEEEFTRGKEQIKSAFIYGQESTASQMLLYGKQLLSLGTLFDFDKRVAEINSTTMKDAKQVIDAIDINKLSLATVGPNADKLKI